MAVHSGYAATIPSSEFRLTSTDGLPVACARWDSRGPVRGVVQIAHGMGVQSALRADSSTVTPGSGAGPLRA